MEDRISYYHLVCGNHDETGAYSGVLTQSVDLSCRKDSGVLIRNVVGVCDDYAEPAVLLQFITVYLSYYYT